MNFHRQAGDLHPWEGEFCRVRIIWRGRNLSSPCKVSPQSLKYLSLSHPPNLPSIFLSIHLNPFKKNLTFICGRIPFSPVILKNSCAVVHFNQRGRRCPMFALCLLHLITVAAARLVSNIVLHRDADLLAEGPHTENQQALGQQPSYSSRISRAARL